MSTIRRAMVLSLAALSACSSVDDGAWGSTENPGTPENRAGAFSRAPDPNAGGRSNGSNDAVGGDTQGTPSDPGGGEPAGAAGGRPNAGSFGVDFGPVPTSFTGSEQSSNAGGAAGSGMTPVVDGGSPTEPGGCLPTNIHGAAITTLETVLTDFGAATSGSLFSIGEAVALDGDTLAVGAVRNSDKVPHGFVFVFVRAGETWSLEATLEPPAGEPDCWFGKSVALHGDTLAVGAPEDFFGTTGGPTHGRIHVFTRTDGSWQLATTLTSGQPEPRDYFGNAIALSGNNLIASAQSELDGRVEVFDHEAGNWRNTQTLAPWHTTPQSTVFSLAMDGARLAVAVGPGVDRPGQAVHVFERSEGRWTRTAELVPDRFGELFGASVALEGDTLVAGDPYQGSNDNSSSSLLPIGAAYVFERGCDGNWTQRGFLKGRFLGGSFGSRVALDGGRIVIADPQDHQHASGIDGEIGERTFDDDYGGAVYVFDRAGAAYDSLNYLKPRDVVLREKDFGRGLAADAGRILVGARGEGAVYSFF